MKKEVVIVCRLSFDEQNMFFVFGSHMYYNARLIYVVSFEVIGKTPQLSLFVCAAAKIKEPTCCCSKSNRES